MKILTFSSLALINLYTLMKKENKGLGKNLVSE